MLGPECAAPISLCLDSQLQVHGRLQWDTLSWDTDRARVRVHMCACACVCLRSLIPFWGDNSEESSCYQSGKEARLFLDHETEQCWLNPPCVSWMFMTSLAVSVGEFSVSSDVFNFGRSADLGLMKKCPRALNLPETSWFHFLKMKYVSIFEDGCIFASTVRPPAREGCTPDLLPQDWRPLMTF